MFCKYCGKPLSADSFCTICGKENLLSRRSTELDELLHPPTPPTPHPDPTPPIIDPIERARKEGYNEGRRIGYNEGRRIGYNEGRRIGYNEGRRIGYNEGLRTNAKSQLVRKFRIVIPVALAIFVLSITVSSSIANRSGQREGWNNAIASLPTPTITVQPTETATIVPLQFTVKEGDRGEHVKRIQAQLSKLGWNVNIDGQFGSETKQAVIEFQQSKGLSATGEVDIITCCALLPQPEATPTISPVPTYTPSPQPNDGAFATDASDGIPKDGPTVDANKATTEEANSTALGSIADGNQ